MLSLKHPQTHGFHNIGRAGKVTAGRAPVPTPTLVSGVVPDASTPTLPLGKCSVCRRLWHKDCLENQVPCAVAPSFGPSWICPLCGFDPTHDVAPKCVCCVPARVRSAPSANSQPSLARSTLNDAPASPTPTPTSPPSPNPPRRLASSQLFPGRGRISPPREGGAGVGRFECGVGGL